MGSSPDREAGVLSALATVTPITQKEFREQKVNSTHGTQGLHMGVDKHSMCM